jgi:hypothetical protein
MGTATAAELQPHELIWSTTNAVVASKCLHVVAALGVADHIDDRPVDAAQLAERCEAHAGALDRVLRLLATHGIFEAADDGFRHTPASRLLRSDHPMSMRGFPQMMNLPLMAQTVAHLEHAVRTGEPASRALEPRGFWAYFEAHPDEGRIFGEAMAAKGVADVAMVLGAYDFSAFGTIADIGGGHGHLVRAILEAAPNAQGVLFDLPEVIARLDGGHERLTAQAGDFFADALPAADAYVLMDILHDWPDAECLAILSAVRRAAAPRATVLIVEDILADGGSDPRGRTLDVVMLAVTGGRERTPTELGALLQPAGFALQRVVETDGPRRIAEAIAI